MGVTRMTPGKVHSATTTSNPLFEWSDDDPGDAPASRQGSLFQLWMHAAKVHEILLELDDTCDGTVVRTRCFLPIVPTAPLCEALSDMRLFLAAVGVHLSDSSPASVASATSTSVELTLLFSQGLLARCLSGDRFDYRT